jgi:hypothetical protein
MHLESRLGGVSLDAWVDKGSELTFDLSWCGVAWVTCCVKWLLTLLINDHVIKRVVFLCSCIVIWKRQNYKITQRVGHCHGIYKQAYR